MNKVKKCLALLLATSVISVMAITPIYADTLTTGTVTKVGSLSSEERLVIDKNDLIDGMRLLINVTDPDGNLAFQLYAYTENHTFSSALSSTGYITVENEFYLAYVDEDTDLSEVNEGITVSFENPNKVVPIYLLNDTYPYYYCYHDQNEIIHLEGSEDTTTTETEPTIGDSDSTEPSETTLQRGDVNGDGTIDAMDLLQLKKYVLGIIDSLE